MKVVCRCQFDITATGVRHHFNASRLPFMDDAGHHITDEATWHRARNQQRNWETLTQILSLRTLPTEITQPVVSQQEGIKLWQFDFVIEQPGALEADGNPLGALENDCQGVPMHVGLDERADLPPCMISQGADSNTWFSVLLD